MIRKISFSIILLFCSANLLVAQKPITAKLSSNDATLSNNTIPPQFPGGTNTFYEYLSNNIKYPDILIKIKLEGDLEVKFTIGKEGVTKDIEIARGFDPDADDEVLRVLRSMPKWTPATTNGNPVDYTQLLTVTFTITDELIEQSKNKTEEKQDTLQEQNNKSQPIIEEKEILEESIAKSDSLNKAPQFIGGQEALNAYFKKNLKYPKRAIEYGIEGRVVYNVEITSDGKIGRVGLVKSLFYECDEEAFYLIKKMPDWMPGLKDGKPATMVVMVPIPFDLPR